MDIYKIGKNVIENLTLGMYSDSKIIFREYIQNSADQIDTAKLFDLFSDIEMEIEIDINTNTRTVQIIDHATGIKASEVRAKLANIADSDKDRDEDKGFRGIGRLGGLAYCDTLNFITSFKGESVETIMRWDAKLCRELINDKTVKDSAEEILRKVVSFETKKCDINEHYFIVELENIREENRELLDIDEVCKYISSNAPVAYNNKFIYLSKIKEYIKTNNLKIDEYKIHVNGNDIFKNYSSNLYENTQGLKKKYDEINDIEFKQFKTKNGELLAWLWFGVSTFDKQIPESANEMRGLRLRKENIQIGESDTLVRLFKESRGNYYFIGEVHAMHKDLIPNARRDYFNENEARNEFESELKKYFAENLHRLYYDANKVKNLFKKETELLKKQAEYSEKLETGFVGNEDKKEITNQLEQAKLDNDRAKNELKRIKEKAHGNETFIDVIKHIEKKHHQIINTICNDMDPTASLEDNNDKKFITDNLHKLDKNQRKLVSKIYAVISKSLPGDLSKSLIAKIQEELNK